MKFHFFLACCFISSSLFAQCTIVGRVINENNEPWLGTFVSPRLFPIQVRGNVDAGKVTIPDANDFSR